jgi:hypothetical protein
VARLAGIGILTRSGRPRETLHPSRSSEFTRVQTEYDIRNEQDRAALRQQYTAIRTMYTRWQQDLLAAIPTARIVELPGANLFMFLSNEADVLREIRAFAATLSGR